MKRQLIVAAAAALLVSGAPALSASKATKGQAPSIAAQRAAIGGPWTRYPDPGTPTDPKLPIPAPIPPPPLKQPYKAEWEARAKATQAANEAGRPPYTGYTQCLPDGMPAMMAGMFPMEILQTPGQVTIIQEAYNQVRRIGLDEKQTPIGDTEPGFFGHSVGHWEGATLVVDTIGVKDKVRFRDTPHSDQMRITERIHMAGPDFLQDEVTITDPVYLERPWTFTWAFTRRPGYRLYEYVCEDNREYRDPATGEARLRVDKK